MTKIRNQLEYYQDKCCEYEKLLEYVFKKLATIDDADYLLRKPRKQFHTLRRMPPPGTREYQELHGITFEDKK